MLSGQMHGWIFRFREHCAQLFQGYRVTGGVLPADPDSHGGEVREPLRKIRVHLAALVCTRHGDELRIVNNGNEPWKPLCSNVGPAQLMMTMMMNSLNPAIVITGIEIVMMIGVVIRTIHSSIKSSCTHSFRHIVSGQSVSK